MTGHSIRLSINTPDGETVWLNLISIDTIMSSLKSDPSNWKLVDTIAKGLFSYALYQKEDFYVLHKPIGKYFAFANEIEQLSPLIKGRTYYDVDVFMIDSLLVGCFDLFPIAIPSFLEDATPIGYQNEDNYMAFALKDKHIGYFMHREANIYQGFWIDSFASFNKLNELIFMGKKPSSN